MRSCICVRRVRVGVKATSAVMKMSSLGLKKKIGLEERLSKTVRLCSPVPDYYTRHPSLRAQHIPHSLH